MGPNIIRIRIRPKIWVRILFVFVFGYFENTNIIRLSIWPPIHIVIVFFISPVHWFHISQQDIVRYNGAKMCQLNHDLVKVKELFIFLLYFQKHVLLSLWSVEAAQLCTIHL